jgi:HD domain
VKVDVSLVDWAAERAALSLSSLEDRWSHVQGAVERARWVGEAFDEENRFYLIASAYLHDIGYAPALRETGFHPLDGARYLRSLGYDRLASLVAHHSEARFEAQLRGYALALSEFPRECSAVADALTYCDMTTGPTGACVSLRERSADVFRRYGETDIVSQALRQALPYLSLAVGRTTRRLRKRGVLAEASQLQVGVGVPGNV